MSATDGGGGVLKCSRAIVKSMKRQKKILTREGEGEGIKRGRGGQKTADIISEQSLNDFLWPIGIYVSYRKLSE